jgi:hypothetical protein
MISEKIEGTVDEDVPTSVSRQYHGCEPQITSCCEKRTKETWASLRHDHKTFEVFPLFEESLRDTVVTVWDYEQQGMRPVKNPVLIEGPPLKFVVSVYAQERLDKDYKPRQNQGTMERTRKSFTFPRTRPTPELRKHSSSANSYKSGTR